MLLRVKRLPVTVYVPLRASTRLNRCSNSSLLNWSSGLLTLGRAVGMAFCEKKPSAVKTRNAAGAGGWVALPSASTSEIRSHAPTRGLCV
jgi:hypothetical protein